MVKILYGIQSDGMGHALRSKPILEHLIKRGHKVKILTADKPYTFLSKNFKDVEEIENLHFFYYNNKVSYLITMLQAVKELDKIISKGVLKIKRIINEYKPDLIISDFEIFTAEAANLMKIPWISLDNITVIKLCKVPYSLKEYNYYMAARIFIDAAFHQADYYFVTTFFKLPLRFKRHNKRVVFVPPILREGILKAKNIKQKDHVLVYQTTQTNKDLIPAILECKEDNFIFYGTNQNKKIKNLQMKKFSEKDFIEDFASAKAVITNGGFTLMSEAIYLGKPILSNPVVGQYEQSMNATMLERYGFGKKVEKISEEKIKSFLYSLEKYKKNLAKYKQDGNVQLFRELDKRISSLHKKYK